MNENPIQSGADLSTFCQLKHRRALGRAYGAQRTHFVASFSVSKLTSKLEHLHCPDSTRSAAEKKAKAAWGSVVKTKRKLIHRTGP